MDFNNIIELEELCTKLVSVPENEAAGILNYLTLENIGNLIRAGPHDEGKKILHILNQSNSKKFYEYIIYSMNRSVEFMIQEEKECRKEHGMSLNDYYDIEHPV